MLSLTYNKGKDLDLMKYNANRYMSITNGMNPNRGTELDLIF
jgi:hypothetical protein